MTGKRLPKMKWWSCHAKWIGKNGAPVDLLFFVQEYTHVGAVDVAKGSLYTMFINEYTIKVVSAPRYEPGSDSYTWRVHRGSWVSETGR